MSRNEEEIVGDYLNYLGKIPILNEHEIKDLINKYKNGDNKAKDKVINSNLRLVVTLASKYADKGLSFMDLIQEGNLGLIKAVERFDTSRNNRFCTYAGHWILRYIYRALGTYVGIIKIPIYMCELIRKYKECIEILCADLNREPTNEEIALYMQISPSQVLNIKEAILTDMPLSSDIELGEDLKLEDTFVDDSITTPLSNITEVSIKKNLKKVISELPIIEQKILINYYGLFGSNPKPLRVIAHLIDRNEKYTGRLKNKALNRIKSMEEYEYLKDYIE